MRHDLHGQPGLGLPSHAASDMCGLSGSWQLSGSFQASCGSRCRAGWAGLSDVGGMLSPARQARGTSAEQTAGKRKRRRGARLTSATATGGDAAGRTATRRERCRESGTRAPLGVCTARGVHRWGTCLLASIWPLAFSNRPGTKGKGKVASWWLITDPHSPAHRHPTPTAYPGSCGNSGRGLGLLLGRVTLGRVSRTRTASRPHRAGLEEPAAGRGLRTRQGRPCLGGAEET